MDSTFWRDRSVFLTGHTGFKGSWLSLWLTHLGAKVHGFALAPPTNPSLFEAARIAEMLSSSTLGDVRDLEALRSALNRAKPGIVFHLAAQPLVGTSYLHPVEAFSVNVMGTVNVLETSRECPSVRVIINVTSDKCYRNQHWPWGYRETDPLGGNDIYSSSKACSELVTTAYRSSFFDSTDTIVATARAGNVIGGGDWAADRLIPDFFRAYDSQQQMMVRNPDAVRPWQHVLDCLAGYLGLAQHLTNHSRIPFHSWNFGPSESDTQAVRGILGYLVSRVPNVTWRALEQKQYAETATLRLDSAQARALLKWRPQWSLHESLDRTIEWYLGYYAGKNALELSLKQLEAYCLATQQ